MCVIIVCEENRPTKELLNKAATQNPHGMGISFLNEEGKVEWRKGWMGTEVPDELFDLTQKAIFPFVVHFRIASVGPEVPLLSHPFVMGEGSPLAFRGTVDGINEKLLFHNGTWSEWWTMLKMASLGRGKVKIPPRPWSDSRAAAFVLGELGEGWLDVILKESQASKWAIHSVLEIEGEKGKPPSLEGMVERHGYWWTMKEYPGMVFSNTHGLDPTPVKKHTVYSSFNTPINKNERPTFIKEDKGGTLLFTYTIGDEENVTAH